MLLVPDDLPDPRRGADHARGTAHVILNMAQALDGHLMGAVHLAQCVAGGVVSRYGVVCVRAGINVLAQGIDGTPRQLVDRLHADPRAVLLGTASFWEGVDMESGILRGLLLCRLPFPVPTDPIVKARGKSVQQPV